MSEIHDLTRKELIDLLEDVRKDYEAVLKKLTDTRRKLRQIVKELHE